MPSTTEPSEYALDPPREGPDFTLNRGWQPDNPSPVLVGGLAPEHPSLQGLRRLEQEYSLAAQLSDAQRLSHTGSFGWDVASGQLLWSEETFRIFEEDSASYVPTLESVLQRTHPEDVASVQQEQAADETKS